MKSTHRQLKRLLRWTLTITIQCFQEQFMTQNLVLGKAAFVPCATPFAAEPVLLNGIEKSTFDGAFLERSLLEHEASLYCPAGGFKDVAWVVPVLPHVTGCELLPIQRSTADENFVDVAQYAR